MEYLRDKIFTINYKGYIYKNNTIIFKIEKIIMKVN